MRDPGRPATHRVFVGIKIPPSIATRLADFGRANALLAPTLRWAHANDMHITLKFLGSVQPTVLEQVRSALAPIRTRPFTIALAGAGSFPSAGILYASIQKSAELFSLQESVEAALIPIGFPREERPYSPHITIARRSGRRRVPMPHDLVSRLDAFCRHMPHRDILVERMILYESISGHYQPLETYDL
jgi:2'-5' RNA ligase